METHIRTLFTDDILGKAGAFYGVSLKELSLIGGFENFIYGFTKNEQSYVMRISHSDHRTYEQTQAELDFVNYLADQGANVSPPIRSIDGNLVEKIPVDEGYFMASAYIKAEGRRANASDFDPQFLFTYGKSVGLLHRLAKTYQPGKDIPKRMDWDEETLYIKASSFLPEEDQIIHDKFVKWIGIANGFERTTDNFGLIHTDYHMGNFFINDGKFTVFDFDDCTYMWFVADLAIILYYHVFFNPTGEDENEKIDLFMKDFMKGYLTENVLSNAEMNHMHTFMKLRQYLMYMVFYRSTDVHVDGFPKRFIERNRSSLIDETPLTTFDFSIYVD